MILIALFFLVVLLNLIVLFNYASNPPSDYSCTLNPSNKWHCENGWYEYCSPESAYSWWILL